MSHSEFTFQLVVESSLNAIVVVTNTGTIVLVNSFTEKLFGYNTSELNGQPIEMLIPLVGDSDHGFYEEFFLNRKKHTTGASLELNALKKDGTKFLVEIGFNPVNSGNEKMLLASVIDITQRRLLERQRSLLISVIESSQDAIIAKSLDGTIWSWNKSSERLFGYTAQEAIGKNISIIIPPYLINEEPNIIEQIRKGGVVNHFETVRIRKDKSEVFISLTISPIIDAEGVVVGASKIARNISDRKTIESALLASEKLYYNLFENLVHGFAYCKAVFDGDRVVDFIYLIANSACESMLGINNLSGKKSSTVTPELHGLHSEYFDVIDQVLKTGKPVTFDTFIPTIKQWFSITVYTPSSGFFVCLIDNITVKKNNNAVVEYQANLLYNINDAVIATDENYIITSWNAAAERMYGWSASEIFQKHISIGVFKGEKTDEHLQATLADIKNNGFSRGEIVHYHQNGSSITVDANTIALYDKEDHFTGLLTVNRDISEKKEAQKKVIESERRFRSLVENDSSIITVLDKSFKSLYRSPSFGKITGRDPDDIALTEISTMIHADDLQMCEDVLRSVVAKPEEQVHATIRMRQKNGNYIWIEGSFVNKLDDPAINGIIANWRDITARIESESRLFNLNAELEGSVRRRTAQLEASNKELEGFSYSVSHDLRAPLRIINGFGSILLEDYGSKLDADGVENLNIIISNADRMGKLIDNLLDFSRLGKSEIHRGFVDMNYLVTESIEELRIGGTMIPTDITIEKMDAVDADNSMIRQIWSNLISNAIKYSSKKSSPAISIGMQTTDEGTHYFIKDNGAGFDMKYYHKMFGVFQRLHNEEEFTGTGVGLALVERIVSKHGGKVWAESEVEQGATFFFTISQSNNVI